MKRIAIVLLVLTLLAGCGGKATPETTTAAPTESATEPEITTMPISPEAASLFNMLPEETRSCVFSFEYDDFDGDGTREAFAYAGDPDDTADLWFIGAGGAQKLEEGHAWFGGNMQTAAFGGSKFLIVAAGRAGYWSPVGYVDILGVKNGRPHAYFIAEEGGWFGQTDDMHLTFWHTTWDGVSYVYPEEDDGEPRIPMRTEKPYWFYWDGAGFREYGGVKITQKQLRRCEGAAEVLDGLIADGETIGNIFYRGNGMININYSKLTKPWPDVNPDFLYTDHGCATLRLSGARVAVVEESGGSYQAALAPDIAAYPELPQIFR